MNRYIKSAALAVLALGSLSSCSDFLEVQPVDKLTQDNYYTSDEMVRSNTLALYAGKTWTNYTHDFQWKTDLLCGDMFYTYSAEGQWYFGTYTSVNQYINVGWEGLYNVIAFCNSVIHDMPSHCQSGVSDAAVTQAIAEARCIRAFTYYLIAELWHDAPIVEDNSTNITGNNLQLPRNTQQSIYRFIMEDLDFAVANLQDTDKEAYRVTRLTALTIRAKVGVTMASHTDYGYDRAALYKQAAADAKVVIDAKPDLATIDYSTLFDYQSNNGPESLLAVQCGVLGYGYGNSRNAAWSRSSVIADQTWGEGKGPTISLQKMYSDKDKRRQWVFMSNGDYYPNLATAQGGYTYNIVNYAADGSEIEHKNEMNAHLKKYVIGKSADCDGMVGLNQDAGNNIYLLRLADVYLLRAEAIMGTAESTTDSEALAMVNKVRERAGLDALESLSYTDLLRERRLEFAFESCNWFDILRYSYRSGKDTAIAYLNDGWGTGYNRADMYVAKGNVNVNTANNPDMYVIAHNKAEGASYDPIYLSTDALTVPLPAAATTSSPQLLQAPVDYYAE